MIPQGIDDILNLWVLSVALAALGGGALIAALRLRRNRSDRLQLRLLAGRRRLLGDELADRCQRLTDLGADGARQLSLQAEAAVDRIHMGLLDREAHLQNLADLADLQRHKIAVLRRQLVLGPQPPGDGGPPPIPAGREGPPADGIVERRERLEDQLLERIQQRADRPVRRRRRRR